MELSERKKQILKAIIGDYILTAEPVGSKALAARPELKFSSATIRNEMSELEEMGYLEKPHTSAGRIPSHLGYRLYVDELMDAYDGYENLFIENELKGKAKELDRLIQEAGRLVSDLTNYASVAVTPHMSKCSIKQFEIIVVDETTFVIVVLTNAGQVKNKLVHTTIKVKKEESELLKYVLNQTLTSIPLGQITAERFDIVRRAAGVSALLAPVAEYIAELIDEIGSQKVFLDGTNKLLRFPEYRDPEKAQALLEYITNADKQFLPECQNIDGVQFFIGSENGENPLANASMIYAKYDIGEHGQGVIGIVGPTRMDYKKLAAKLSNFAKELNKLIADNFLDDKNK